MEVEREELLVQDWTVVALAAIEGVKAKMNVVESDWVPLEHIQNTSN